MKSNRYDFLPVILGADENAYGTARLFNEKYGIIPLLFSSRNLTATECSHILIRKIIPNLELQSVFSSLMPVLLNSLKNEYGKILLIPCSDYYAELCVRNHNLISPFIENPFNSPSLFYSFSNKIAFYNLCRDYNLPHPQTIISTPYFLLTDKNPFGYPCILKPQNSNSTYYLHLNMKNRKKVYLCRNDTDYISTLKNFIDANYTSPLILQEYIPGSDSCLRVLNSYSDKFGKVRAIGCGKPLLEYYDPDSIGNYAAIKTVKDRILCNIAADFLNKIGYKGFANFDAKINPETNKIVFFELNPRLGRSSYFIHTAGVNLMEYFVSDIIDNKKTNGISYAEKDGIWMNIPHFLLKRYSDYDRLSSQKPEHTLSYFYDFSPQRAIKLLHRDKIIEDKFSKYYFDKKLLT